MPVELLCTFLVGRWYWWTSLDRSARNNFYDGQDWGIHVGGSYFLFWIGNSLKQNLSILAIKYCLLEKQVTSWVHDWNLVRLSWTPASIQRVHFRAVKRQGKGTFFFSQGREGRRVGAWWDLAAAFKALLRGPGECGLYFKFTSPWNLYLKRHKHWCWCCKNLPPGRQEAFAMPQLPPG